MFPKYLQTYVLFVLLYSQKLTASLSLASHQAK